MSGRRLFLDYDKCIGCETCEAACRFARGRQRIHMTRTKEGVMAPLYCQHCDRPTCATACPHGALTQDAEGGVLQDHDTCRSCEGKECLDACPYAAIFCTGERYGVLKCDMCAERRECGQEPACVAMCPCKALKLVDRDDVKHHSTDEHKKAFRRVIQHLRPPKAE